MLIKKGLSESMQEPYFRIESAKVLWDSILLSKTGTSTLQFSRYEMVKSEIQFICVRAK